ncbi:MAG: GNAT family N-acetyltransferase [Alphaproteobacteria bacterium]
MSSLQIRPATRQEFATAIDWAAAEGWNPGLDDLAAFHAADPAGFLMGFVDGEAISSISVVRYGAAYGFLGFYIVHPDHRGTGAGIATWNAGMEHLSGRTVGLDGVVDQQENYRKSGFVLAGRNIRYTGVPAFRNSGNATVRRAATGDLENIIAYDRRHFPADRPTFLREWVLPADPATRRTTLIAIGEGNIAGQGTIRACRDGFKIGPLFAESRNTAETLFAALCHRVPRTAAVSLDVPEDNPQAVDLATTAGLSPVFETARMYRGEAPDLPLSNIYGITTFELG